jgi:hypothetical protein
MMKFESQRRQQFLSENFYREQLPEFDAVINDPDGLEANLRQPEREPSWHNDLARGVGFEKFNRLLLRYTAGEPIEPLRDELKEIISAYERYGEYLWKYTGDRNEVVLKFYDLDEYCQLMQLIGLCFLLHRRDLLPRLAALQDGENGTSNGGADWIYEEFMSYALGAANRFESEQLCCSKPYEYLADALSSTDNDTALKELNLFLKHWYKDLAGTGWHDSHKPDEDGNMGGCYYGYWSFEAGAAVLLLGIEDDSSLHKYLYYPKDLVAWARDNADRFPNGGPDTTVNSGSNVPAGQPCPESGWWFTPAKTGSRRYFRQGDLFPDYPGSDYGSTFWQRSPDQSTPKL